VLRVNPALTATAHLWGTSIFAAQLKTAIEGAYLHQLDPLSRDLWKSHDTGLLGDEDAQRLAELIYSRREALRDAHRSPQTPVSVSPGRFTLFKPRRLQRPPQRSKAIERRRTLAASGPLPPRLSSKFTTGAMAVLRVVADAAKGNGAQCVKSVAEIAARAGVCHRLAQYTIRLAECEGLVVVEERRQHGAPNLVNIVRIICDDWLSWLKGRRGNRGCRKVRSTTNRFSVKREKAGWSRALRPVLEGFQGPEHPPPRRC
jgi:hypothetical protein